MTAWVLYYAQWALAIAQTVFALWLGIYGRRNVLDREWPWSAWVDQTPTFSEEYDEQSDWRRS